MLSSLDVEQFRCITRAHLDFDVRATGIVGANASGKTSLLEAIYFLAHGRSFRVAHRDKLIQAGAGGLRVVGRVADVDGTKVVGVEYAAGTVTLHVGGAAAASFSSVATVLPVQIIDPGVHRLIEEGSARRRRLLDWGVFHVEHEFLRAWRRYQRALQQRNAALRAGSEMSMVGAWDGELCAAAAVVDQHRMRYMEEFAQCFRVWADRLVGHAAAIEYRRGWPLDVELSQALEAARPRDQRLRTTTVGPHRADLVFKVDGANARDRVSRGQQKMLASSFVLAQVAFRATRSQQRTCLLLDDPAAELDVDNLGKLFAALADIPAQLVITAVSHAGLHGLSLQCMFHVEQGVVRPLL